MQGDSLVTRATRPMMVDAAPAVVGQAFVDVVAVEAVTAVAGRTRAASVK